MEERFVSVKEATKITSVCRRTIYNWLRAGKLNYKRTAGGKIRIAVSSLWSNKEVQHGTTYLGGLC